MKFSFPLLKAFEDLETEAGCDEAGRGCLAGPVYGAAVILGNTGDWSFLRDSKKMKPLEREEAAACIEKQARAWAVCSASPGAIDRINILQASIQAIHRALATLAVRPRQILMDGSYFIPFEDIPHVCLVKGDNRFLAIAAASILAKVHRDRFMLQQHDYWPVYGWDRNKGYPTAAHKAALHAHGPSALHRRSFKW